MNALLSHPLDAVVIGAGQAGLAAAYALQQARLRFTVLEASAQVGGSWTHHYEQLRLFSPARFSSLPGLAFPGDPDAYPGRDDVSAYLRAYAEHFAFPLQTEMPVMRVCRNDAGFQVETAAGTSLTTRTVIAATGAFHRPFLPALPQQERFQGQILHSSTYRNVTPFQGQRVVVVGAGNSAVQIAVELAAVARVTLATRSPVRFAPQRLLGRDIHWWWWLTGFDRLSLDALPGRWLARAIANGGTQVLDTGRYQDALAADAPDQQPMFSRFTEQGVIWSDGRAEPLDAVIFATGYRPNLDYLADLGALTPDGQALHRQGLSTVVPGLSFVGLSNQRTYASASLRGVGPDAALVVAQLQRVLRQRAPEQAEERNSWRRCCAGLFGTSR